MSRGSTGRMEPLLVASKSVAHSADILFDLLDVAQHFAPCPVFVVHFDRTDNPPMSVDGGFPTRIGLQGILTASTQKLHQAGNQFLQRPVPRGSPNREMKLRVRFDPRRTAAHRLGLLRNNPFELRHIFPCGSFRGQRGNLRLDQLAHFKHVRQRFLFVNQQVRQWPDQRFHRQVDDKISHAGPADDQSLALQRPKRLSHGGPTDFKNLGQFALRRQLIAGFESAFLDQLMNLAKYLLVNPSLLIARSIECPAVWWSDQF